MKYVLVYNDGITSVSSWQARNFCAATGEFDGSDVIAVTCKADAMEQFASIAAQTYRDVEGGASASVYLANANGTLDPYEEPIWDLSIGARGGIVAKLAY